MFDEIDYYFDSIDSFYAEVDDLLKRPYSNEDHVKHMMTQLITFLARYQDEFLTSRKELAHIAYKLIDSKPCLDYSTVVLGHILTQHALASHDMKELIISYSLLLYAGKDESAWLEYIVFQAIRAKRNRLFAKIIQEVASGLYSDYRMCGVAFSLLFEMCKLVGLEKEDRVLLDETLFHHFLDLVQDTRGDADESFNYDVIRLITVLNEQFLMSSQENVLMQVLQQRRADTFSANLIFMLNRSDDSVVQMLIVKSLYCIFTTPKLYEYFYTNDLYVLIDIILRVLCDLGDTKEAQTLRDAYLRLLEPILENTQLRNAPYKKNDIYRILMSLVNPSMQRKVHPTTKRIVTRILEDWWEKLACNTPPMMFTARYNSMHSLDSSSGPATPDSVVQVHRKDNAMTSSSLDMDTVHL